MILGLFKLGEIEDGIASYLAQAGNIAQNIVKRGFLTVPQPHGSGLWPA